MKGYYVKKKFLSDGSPRTCEPVSLTSQDLSIKQCWYIEAETKLSPFYKRYFQIHFWVWTSYHFHSNFSEICSQRSNEQHTSIDSDNGLVPNRRQAIIWFDYGLIYWLKYASLHPDELRCI